MNINLNNISNTFHTMPRNYLVITGISIGILAYPLIKKIASVALNIFIEIVKYFSNLMDDLKYSTFYIRLHSLACEDCAAEHKNHMV